MDASWCFTMLELRSGMRLGKNTRFRLSRGARPCQPVPLASGHSAAARLLWFPWPARRAAARLFTSLSTGLRARVPMVCGDVHALDPGASNPACVRNSEKLHATLIAHTPCEAAAVRLGSKAWRHPVHAAGLTIRAAGSAETLPTARCPACARLKHV